MPFAKAQQECQSFLDFFYCRTFFKGDCKPFWRNLFLFFKYKSLVKQALPIYKIGAKRQPSGMDSELKSSHSFLKTT
jgi:predicted amidophosphoribosyltransferase